MAGSIGSVDFDLFWGTIAGLKKRSDVWEVPGQDGYGIEILGLGDADFNVKGASYFSGTGFEAAADAYIGNCESLQGTIIAITDAFGTTYDGCFIEHVDTENAMRPCIFGGHKGMRVEITFKCKRMP